MRVLCRSLDDKRFVWFEKSNRYLQMEEPAYEVFTQLNKAVARDSIAVWFSKEHGLSIPESRQFVNDIKEFISSLDKPPILNKTLHKFDIDQIPTADKIFSCRYYRFAGTAFCFQFSHHRIERMIHPLLAHLEIGQAQQCCHQVILFRIEDSLCLSVNEKFIGQWCLSEGHLFKGKVFMELLNMIYLKKEDDWMAVMHGSCISNGDSCIILMGDSGSGKSTAASILLSNGFKFMADDFVPVEGASGNVYQMPTAISVKDGAMDCLCPCFPELKQAEEFYYEEFNKTVHYLSPQLPMQGCNESQPVSAIVFVNYEPGVELNLKKKPKIEAFQFLITESWLSPRFENAERFFDWANSMSFYQLNYSNSQQLVTKILELFDDEQY